MNRRTKTITALAIFAIAGAALTGCGIQEGAETSRYYPESHYTFEQELPDGGTVLCVWAKSGYGGGLSCDWANAGAR
ncbi:hypothetical protein [Streptomyces sp. AC495_CC817]|uniref:hypothetical protein n=1 Tax=Streptomyces sp. AC495_CC817 TaxID=2823900 RepID=UPI001C26EB38|nr:hypothetical protein [Streptomyces sp. AC495_CC817]